MSLRLGLTAALLAAGGCLPAPAASASTATPQLTTASTAATASAALTAMPGGAAAASPQVETQVQTAAVTSYARSLEDLLLPDIPVHDYDLATAPRRHDFSSDAYTLDEPMQRCLTALATVQHLPLRFYRISCAPIIEQGNSTSYAALVGGNTYRTSEDIVIGTFLSPAAFERLIKHEAVHGFTIEHRSVRYALERWAHPDRPDSELTGNIMDDPAPYPQNPSEVYAAAWARCHGAGPDPVVEDARMTCEDAERITRAALTPEPWPAAAGMATRTLLP